MDFLNSFVTVISGAGLADWKAWADYVDRLF